MTSEETRQQTTDSDEFENERKRMEMRREARRKKILENAKDRLAKLGGRETPMQNGTIAYEQVSDPEVEPDIPNLLRADVQAPVAQAEHFQFNENMQMDFSALLTGMVGDTATTSSVAPKEENFWQRTRLHVILIALITFALSASKAAALYTTGLSVFTLLGVCLITELLFFTREREVAPLIKLTILLSGVRPNLTKRMMHLWLVLYNIFTDLGIFVFCYSMFSIMFVLWDDNNADLLTMS